MSTSIFDVFLDHDRRQDRALDRIDQSITAALENQAMSAEALFRQIRELYALDREQDITELGEVCDRCAL